MDSFWLYKETRAGAGDDWAEKVAEQLAELLGLPHAITKLARRDGVRGMISRDFRRADGDVIGPFVPGNELLSRLDPTYPKENRRQIEQYTVERCFELLETLQPLPPITGGVRDTSGSAAEVFAGYLLFDAWIGNHDRHHENWGILESLDPTARPVLAPSFDHASSLGQNETDAKRAFRLETKDKRGTLDAWTRKATTPFHAPGPGVRPLSTLDSARIASARYSGAAAGWLGRLEGIRPEAVEAVLARVPSGWMSPTARRFAARMLLTNRDDLLRIPR